MCYPNSDLTYHEVPEQLEEFDRISGLSRTLWNSKGSRSTARRKSEG